jgi:hypothetical protein
MPEYLGDRTIAEKEHEDSIQEQGFMDEFECIHGVPIEEDCPECFLDNFGDMAGNNHVLKEMISDIEIPSPDTNPKSKEGQCGDASPSRRDG